MEKDNALHRQVFAWEVIFLYDKLRVILWKSQSVLTNIKRSKKFKTKCSDRKTEPIQDGFGLTVFGVLFCFFFP